MTYAEKLKDPRWQKKRLLILERDGWACLLCGDADETLHVHHKSYTKTGNPWDSDNDQLMTVCRHCHIAIEELKGINKKLQIPEAVIKFKDGHAGGFYMVLFYRGPVEIATIIYYITGDKGEFLSLLKQDWVTQINEKLAALRSK